MTLQGVTPFSSARPFAALRRGAVRILRTALRRDGRAASATSPTSPEHAQMARRRTSRFQPKFTAEEALVLEAAEKILARTVRKGGLSGTSPDIMRRYLRSRFAPYEREVFTAVFMDSQHRMIEDEELFFGTIDGTSVHPREVVKAALKHNASAVCFAHNHPSGVAEPSQADIRITERLRAALALVDVRVLDHFIVGNPDITSLAERGLV